MNREILFRGKRVDNGELIESDSIQQLYGGSKVYLWYQGKWIEVISKTVGQYTGLTGRHGKKIFEGDIVRIFEGEKFEYHAAEVFYCEDIGQFRCVEKLLFNTTKNPLHIREAEFDYISLQHTEVIGNIHDNPELLKGDENENIL